MPLYWIIDGEERQAEDRLVWQPAGAGDPLTLPLQELLRAIE